MAGTAVEYDAQGKPLPASAPPAPEYDASGKPITSAAPTPGDSNNQEGFLDPLVKPIQNAYDSAVTPISPDERAAHPILSKVADFGRGAMDLAQPVMHPVKTGIAMVPHSATDVMQDMANPMLRPMMSAGKGIVNDFKQNGPGEAIPHMLGSAVGGFEASEVPGMAADIHEAAMGSPDAAALRGLQVGPRSDAQLSTLGSVEKARPYLQGASSQADMQTRLKPAMNEVWNPYQQAIEAVGDKPVKGPDGITTVRALEQERLRLSALNRGVKAGNPSDIQQVMQEGRTPAQNIEREAAVQSALDPHLAATGIDPKLIRDTYSGLADVRGGVEGKTTLNEKPQPSGLGRMMNMRLTEPKTLIGEPAQGVRDLIAGRPMWSAKPTDLGIKEGFRMGGEKPNLGQVTTTGNPPPPSRLLPAPAREMPAPEYNGRVEGYQPPPIAADTTAMRTGRLLPAPGREMPAPQYNGRIEGYQPPPVDAGTDATRLGRLLPENVPARELPLSSHADIFPDQISHARLLDYIKRSK